MGEIRCFFDIGIDGRDCGRIVFKLYNNECPKTCENFRCLCTGEKGFCQGSNKPLHYKDTPFHRIVRNFIIQGGDITDHNGKGGDSIYGGTFADENLTLAHDEPYLLSMANRGPDTNKSQFFITTNEAPHLDGKHVVFGRVVSGLDTILKVERLEVDSKSRPLKDVIIKDCGQVASEPPPPAPVTTNDGAIIANKGKKRKLSTTSLSSDKSHRNSPVSPSSQSESCSRSGSSSSASSSSSGSLCSSSHSRRPALRGRRQPSVCSSASDSSYSGSNSGSGSESDASSSGSVARIRSRRRRGYISDSSEQSDLSSGGRSRKRQKTNSTLSPSRGTGNSRSAAPAKNRNSGGHAANQNYKCSINLDEIPEVPANRFLQRVPTKPDRPLEVSEDDSIGPIEVDLSKFEDIPDEEAANQPAAAPLPSKLAIIKTNEPVVSKSGRIMRGRGTFKFRTPSPESDRPRSSNRRASPDRYHDNRRSSRWDRIRSGDRYASPHDRLSRRDGGRRH